MVESCLLTIITPTFNRRYTIDEAYQSLKNQTNQNFQWLVIDDGSTDGTDDWFSNLKEKTEFQVEYHYKKNGGKHTALNFSFPYIRGRWVLILDSDDYLIPEAVEIVSRDCERFENDNVGYITYQKGYSVDDSLSNNAPYDYYQGDFDFVVNRRAGGDCCEVFRTTFLSQFPFPQFKGEKYMPEGWFWLNIAQKTPVIFRNTVIYICQYLTDGLSKAGRKLRLMSPNGMMMNCKAYFRPGVGLQLQLKEMLLFVVYAKRADLSLQKTLRASGRSLACLFVYLPGLFLYHYWCRKYL